MKRLWWVFTLAIFCVLLMHEAVLSQINIPNSNPVTENFNSIGTSATASLPANWKMSAAGGTADWGTATNVANTTQQASTGSPTTGGRYNWATTGGADRAIGFMTSGSYASPNTILVFYRNTTGTTISDLTIDFQFERYRINTAAASVTFFTSNDGVIWTARTAGDIPAGVFATGASTYTFGSPQTVTRSVVLTGINVPNNGDFYLRWVVSTTGSNSQGLGLDDVTVTATTAASVPDLSIDDVSASEGNAGTTNLAFTVSLSSPAPAGGVTFDIATQDNTATVADNDYLASNLTGQTIPAGSSNYTFNVTVNGDTAIEANETFFVNVGNVTGATVTDGQGTGTIGNDDFDTTAPSIAYTALTNTVSTASPTLVAIIADDSGVPTAGSLVPRIYYRKNTDAYVSNACTLASGTGQNGTWNCIVDYALVGGVLNDSITYFVIAQDTSGNLASNPGGALATDVNTVSAAPPAPNLYTIGQSGVPAGGYSYLSVGDATSLGGAVSVATELSLGGIVDTNGNTLSIACDGTISGAGANAYVVGNLEKIFCATGGFTFPVGTTPDPITSVKLLGGIGSEYTPLTANATAGTFPSSLTVTVTDAFLSGVDLTQSASRFWNVTENGNLTFDLSFTYLDEDVNGTETNYQVIRRLGTTTNVYPGGTVNAAANTGSAPGVADTSSWSVGRLAFTASNASISGRVLTADGRPIRGATVVVTGGNLTAPRYFQTGSFGRYQFTELPVGETYVVSVVGKKYNFPTPSRVVNLQEDLSEIDFEAEER